MFCSNPFNPSNPLVLQFFDLTGVLGYHRQVRRICLNFQLPWNMSYLSSLERGFKNIKFCPLRRSHSRSWTSVLLLSLRTCDGPHLPLVYKATPPLFLSFLLLFIPAMYQPANTHLLLSISLSSSTEHRRISAKVKTKPAIVFPTSYSIHKPIFFVKFQPKHPLYWASSSL